MNNQDLTEFQQRGVRAVQALLARKGIEAERKLGGESETYAVLAFTLGEHAYEVFVYEDEAGVLRDRKWNAFESPDFDDVDSLLKALSAFLEKSLGEDI